MNPAFTIKEAISYGWKKTLENFGFLAVLLLSFFVVTALLDSLNGLFEIIGVAVGYFAAFTFVRVILQIHRGHKPTAKGVFEFEWKMFGYYVLAALFVTLITGIGFFLLIIPGIYLTVRLTFFAFALIEEKQKPIDSLKTSWEMTRGHFWPLLGLTAVIVLINIAGVIAFGVGLLITAPLGFLATVYAYDKLKKI